jgi:hypothetical protein
LVSRLLLVPLLLYHSIVPLLFAVLGWMLHNENSNFCFFISSFRRETRNFCVAAAAAAADRFVSWLIIEFLYGFVVSVFGCHFHANSHILFFVELLGAVPWFLCTLFSRQEWIFLRFTYHPIAAVRTKQGESGAPNVPATHPPITLWVWTVLRTDTAHPQPPFPLIIPSVGLVSR